MFCLLDDCYLNTQLLQIIQIHTQMKKQISNSRKKQSDVEVDLSLYIYRPQEMALS